MNNKDIAKKNYDKGMWSKEMLKALVTKGRLTQAEFKEITGENYQ